MSEPLEEDLDRQVAEQLSGLRRVYPAAPFAPAASVRRRGRRRGYRRALSAGVAVLAVAGLSVGGVAIVTEQVAPPVAPPPATAVSPTVVMPTDIADEWLLSSDDLGLGEWQTDWEPERFEGEPFQLWAGVCPAVGHGDFPSLAQRRDLRVITWSNRSPETSTDQGGFEWVDQVVELYAPGGAVGNIDDLQNALAECRGDNGDGPDLDEAGSAEQDGWWPTPRYDVVAGGFAGDQALLVAERLGDDVSLSAVVRVGDVLVTLRHFHPQTGRADQERLIELSIRATERLR